MASPLLASKLGVPQRRDGFVARPRLVRKLAWTARLTLLSAPAGFGKTTLLADRLADHVPTAWVSLDEGDGDPTVFWSYVAAALHGATAQQVGGSALSLLKAPQPPLQSVISSLLNDMHAAARDLVLVLDDLHAAESPEVLDGLTYLIEHLPAGAHLVIATRSDPAVPLARLRARGDLVEIRATDLAFTRDECAVYLNESMGLSLRTRDVAILEHRTEGWIAALQLAALSVQGHDAPERFIGGFAGDDRHVVDLLSEEILQQLPDQLRRFLLVTSILHRLCGPLCDAVTGAADGAATLVALERRNLFVFPLDARRRWYRYHQLFADLLQARLHESHGDDVADLHRRASVWYADHDDPVEAVRHALAAGDHERAAELMELAIPALSRDRREDVIRDWADRLPDHLLRVRPVLSIGLAGGLAAGGALDRIDRLLRYAERWADVVVASAEPLDVSTGGMVVADAQRLPSVPAAIHMYRAAQALAAGDLDDAERHARAAVARAPADDHLARAAGTALSALAAWSRADLTAAAASYEQAMRLLARAGHDADVIGCALALADIQITQGLLGDALRTYGRGLAIGEGSDDHVLRGTPDMLVGLGDLHRERGDIDAAREFLRRSATLGEHMGLPQHPYRWRVAEARLLTAEHDLDRALRLLDEADRVYEGDFSPNVQPVPAVRARLHVARGDLAAAFDWVRGSGVTVADRPDYLREYEHVTLARVLLARNAVAPDDDRLDDVERLLQRLHVAAEAGGRTTAVLEIMVTQAVAAQQRGAVAAALAALHDALQLAAPEGYVRLFADAGAPVAALLETLVRRGASEPDARRVLAAMTRSAVTDRRQPLVEPLTDREFDVLRLLDTDMSGPDIARHLVVSLNTVRTHTKHIYTKLGVGTRRAAVRRARDLRLL